MKQQTINMRRHLLNFNLDNLFSSSTTHTHTDALRSATPTRRLAGRHRLCRVSLTAPSNVAMATDDVMLPTNLSLADLVWPAWL